MDTADFYDVHDVVTCVGNDGDIRHTIRICKDEFGSVATINKTSDTVEIIIDGYVIYRALRKSADLWICRYDETCFSTI